MFLVIFVITFFSSTYLKIACDKQAGYGGAYGLGFLVDFETYFSTWWPTHSKAWRQYQKDWNPSTFTMTLKKLNIAQMHVVLQIYWASSALACCYAIILFGATLFDFMIFDSVMG